MKRRISRVISSVLAAAILMTASSSLLSLPVNAAPMEKVDISGGSFSESSAYDGYEGKAWDGDVTSQWAALGAGECWLQADFESAISFNCVKIYETPTEYSGNRMTEVAIQTSETGNDGEWTTVKKFTGLQNNGTYEEILLLDETIEANHIKLVIDSDGREININEVEFYNRGEDTARDKLGQLINQASALDTRIYKIQFSQPFVKALASAKTVYNNDNMLDGQINDAYRILDETMQNMLPNTLGENLALGATAEANSTYGEAYDQDGYGAEFAVDGNFNTRWASDSEDRDFEYTITLDMGQPKEFNQLILFETTAYPGRMKMISVQVSSDGQHWEDWRMDAEHVPTTSSLVGDMVTKQYIKILMTSSGSGNGLNVDEIGVYQDEEAIETTYITDKRPIDPNWIKPIPSETANTYQLRKQEMGYGMFIHYGVNTFTNNEWGSGSEDPSVYNPNPETFDPEQWAKTAWEAGMNYIVLITKHHDGFALFDTKYSDHKVTNCGHEGVDYDVVDALAKACRKYGIKLGLYYSVWDMHWEQENPQSNFVDVRAWDQAYADFIYNQVEELMTNYGEICELWLDGGWLKETERWEYERLYNMVKTYQPGCQVSVNLTMGDTPINTLQGGEEIVNFPSDFKLYDGQDTREDNDPKVFQYQGENYYLPFEGTFIIGNGWFWNTNSSEDTLRVSADQIKNWYDKYQRQENTLVINVPPSNQGVQTEHEINLIYEAAQKIGIARGDARLDKNPNEKIIEVRHVDTNGNIAATTEYIYGQKGESYTTSPNEKLSELGYTLTTTPENATGMFGDEKIVVEYVYHDDLSDPVDPEPEESTNKTSLKFYLDKANAVDSSVIESLVESAQVKFTGAVENGQKVFDNATATQEEVNAAAKELRIALNMLSMVAGDKEVLNDLIADAEDLIANAGNDYPQSAIDALQDAIDAAKEVANDGDAFQADVDKAVEDLQNAIEAFNNSKLDWRALEAAVADGATIAADMTEGKYVEDSDAFKAFNDAYAAAQELLNNKTVDSQEAIDEATTALLEAGSNLRYKADKDTLKAVIGEAENVDESLYTAESVAMFRTAFAAANTVLADESWSVDDQATVDNAAATLEEAMAALVPIETADGGDNNTTGTTTGSDDTAVAEDLTTPGTKTVTITTETGDVNALPIALAVIVLAAGAGFVFRKKFN